MTKCHLQCDGMSHNNKDNNKYNNKETNITPSAAGLTERASEASTGKILEEKSAKADMIRSESETNRLQAGRGRKNPAWSVPDKDTSLELLAQYKANRNRDRH